MIAVTEGRIRMHCAACDRSAMVSASAAGFVDAETVWAITAEALPGWRVATVGGRPVYACPACVAAAEVEEAAGRRRAEAGFTLTELLVVIMIVGLVAALAVPAVVSSLADRRLESAARLVHGALTAAKDRAIAGNAREAPFSWAVGPGYAGVRLVPDPSLPVRRLADGSIDPDAALVYSRLLPLRDGGTYAEGSAALSEGRDFPKGFSSPAGLLVLEESKWNRCKECPDGRQVAPPASWWWNVRVGDRLEMRGHVYTVVGPLVWGADRNPDLFVNHGEPGAASPLDRGDGPREFLLLVNGLDDDRDGVPDNGFTGVAAIDAAGRETERWRSVQSGDWVWGERYRIHRGPIVDAAGGVVDLPAGIVVDASGWGAAVKDRPRSRVPVDPVTGGVDLILDQFGRVEFRGRYSTPTAAPWLPWVHFWLCDLADVRDPAEIVPGPGAVGRLVSLQTNSGALASGPADPADPAGSVRAIEQGGGR